MTDTQKWLEDPAAYSEALADFVVASPSSYHAADAIARALTQDGFTLLDEADPWTLTAGRYVVIRDGAAIAWVLPDSAIPLTPVRIFGTHTDSPGFKLKPHATASQSGWLQAGAEIYGGPVLSTWLDRELELAGRVVDREGRAHLVRSGPMLRIPHLAIHLDRTAGDTTTLDRQRHTQPVFGLAGADTDGVDIMNVLAEASSLDPADIVGHDIVMADTQRPARFGLGGALFASGRLDNLSSVFAGLMGLRARANGAQQASHISMFVAFDHEELGSASRSGASGPFLSDILNRIYASLHASEDDRAAALARSWCVSADAGHSVHPNYPERHDPVVAPVAGGGPLLKINANQRYATDAYGAVLWDQLCHQAGVAYQEFVSNNAVPCGSTIGPLTATRLGIRTFDVGVPLLSMHSARELAHTGDLAALGAIAANLFASQ